VKEDPIEAFTREIGPTLERIGAEIEKIFGNPNRAGAPEPGRPAAQAAPDTHAAPGAQSETLLKKRERLDGELRRGLEQLGVVVRGADVARAVSAAVGKRIEWTG
jgi:hypothetical protein